MFTQRFRSQSGSILPIAHVFLISILGTGLSACSPPTSSSPAGDSPRRVTVQFDDSGATIPVGAASMTVDAGKALGQLPEAPAKEAALFLGWYTSTEGDTPFTAQTPVHEDMTAYAHWKPWDSTSWNPLVLTTSLDGQRVMVANSYTSNLWALSTDGGTTWSELKPFADHGTPSVVFSTMSANGRNLFAYATVTDQIDPVARFSSDGGITWQTAVAPFRTIASAVISDAGTVAITDVNGKFQLSTDRGLTWSESQPFGHTNPTQLVMTPDGSTLLAVSSMGQVLGSTTDWGTHWDLKTVLWSPSAPAISFDGSRWAVVVAGASGSLVYASNDRGITWTPGTVKQSWQKLVYFGLELWASDGKGMFLSTGADQWQSVSGAAYSWLDIAAAKDKLLAWNATYGLVETKDGKTWTWAGRKTVIRP